MFENLEDDEFTKDEMYEGDAGQSGAERGNRTFVIAAFILGLLTIGAMICGGVYLFSRAQSGERNAQLTQQAVAYAQQTQEALSVQQTVEAQSWTATPTATVPATATPTPTEVVALPTATQQEAVVDPATATVAALLTQAAGQPTQDPSAVATITVVVTGLPDTGVFDDYGITGLILLAFFALVVMFLARRLRTANR